MTTLEKRLKKDTERLLGKGIAKAEIGAVSTLYFYSLADATVVDLILSKQLKTTLEEEKVREPYVEGMTREQRRNRKFIPTGLYTVSY